MTVELKNAQESNYVLNVEEMDILTEMGLIYCVIALYLQLRAVVGKELKQEPIIKTGEIVESRRSSTL